jgi:hypothetical protein
MGGRSIEVVPKKLAKKWQSDKNWRKMAYRQKIGEKMADLGYFGTK